MIIRVGFGTAIIAAVAISVAAFATLAASCGPSNPASQSEKGTGKEIADSLPAKGASHDGESAGGITGQAREQAREIFDARCAACHGDDGRGNGPAASNVKPKPIDFHNPNWQASVSDADIAKAIVHGGSAVGLSSQMQSNPDLEDEPGVVDALVERIRKWAK